MKELNTTNLTDGITIDVDGFNTGNIYIWTIQKTLTRDFRIIHRNRFRM